MKPRSLFLLIALFLLHPSSLRASDQDVVMVIPAQVPAFEAIRQGIEESLPSDLHLTLLLATDFRGKPGGVVDAAVERAPLVVLSVGTGLSQSFLAASRTQTLPPVIAVAITDAADVLGAELAAPRSVKMTVVLDGPPSIYPNTADLIASLVPHLTLLGTVYNPGERNSVSNLDKIRSMATQHGWKLAEESIANPDDVPQVARSLVDRGVQAILISKDRIMTSAPTPLIEYAHRHGVPVFASDAGTVQAFGALGTSSVSFEQLGEHVAHLVARIAQGESVSDMPVSTVERTTVFLSAAAVSQLKIAVPDSILQAATVFGSMPAKTAARASDRSNHNALYLLLLVVVVATVIVLARRSLKR